MKYFWREGKTQREREKDEEKGKGRETEISMRKLQMNDKNIQWIIQKESFWVILSKGLLCSSLRFKRYIDLRDQLPKSLCQ